MTGRYTRTPPTNRLTPIVCVIPVLVAVMGMVYRVGVEILNELVTINVAVPGGAMERGSPFLFEIPGYHTAGTWANVSIGYLGFARLARS